MTVKTQRTQCSKKQKNRAGMYLYRKMTQQNRAGMYLYRKMTGHFSEIALRCICTEKQPVIRHPRVFSRSGTKENTSTVQTRTDSCSNTVRRSAVAALGGSNPSSGAVSRGPQCKAAQTADQLSDFSTSRDESVRKFPKRKHEARKVSRVKRLHIALTHH